MNKSAVADSFVLILLMVFPLVCPVAQSTNSEWNIQTVAPSIADEMGRGGFSNCELALDSNANPYIIYVATLSEGRGSTLNYAHWNGKSWSSQEITNYGPIDYSNAALAVDRNNKPHIVYSNFPPSIVYASWNGSGFNTQTVEVGYSPSLVFDLNNQPHILGLTNNLLEYAVQSGSSWDKSTVEDLSNAYLDSSALALDRQGKPYVAYIFTNSTQNASGTNPNAQTTEILMCANWDGSVWNKQSVYYFGIIGQKSVSIAIDPNGNPHISFGGHDSSQKYASWNGTNWNIQIVDENESGGSTLAIDSHGNPKICYNGVNGIKYASWNGLAWDIQTIDNGFGSMVLDKNGNPHFCYVAGDLMYASTSALPTTANTESTQAIIVTVVIVVVVGGLVAVLFGKRVKRKRQTASTSTLNQPPNP
jgi:hypothetical protein